MLLGNAILALRENFGPNWECDDYWTGSTSEIYKALRRTGEKLRGPSRIGDNQDYYSSRNRGSHSVCSRSDQFLERLAPIYESAVVSLSFEVFGNMAYREHLPVDDGEKSKWTDI
jgi:hypothetical protein